MKTNTFKKLLSVATSLSLALAFTFMQSNVASALNIFNPQTLEPGEDTLFYSIKAPDPYTSCTVDATQGGYYQVTSANSDTKFTMFLQEAGKQIAEDTFTGKGKIDLEPRSYKALSFGVKNIMDKADTFTGAVESNKLQCTNGATRILAPIAALIGGLLFLF